MGVYIDMKMPKSCWDCYFQDCGNCLLNSHKAVDKNIVEDRIDEDCPLIEVLEPHGRLGDLDALPWYLANTSVKYATYEDWEMLCDAIAAAPLSSQQARGAACNRWEPMRCRCGGALSEIREHNGKRYRHCYSCHFEFFEEGN